MFCLVPFALRLPIARISCTSMEQNPEFMPFFCCVFHVLAMVPSKHFRCIFLLLFCRFFFRVDHLFFAPQFVKYNDRSWIWCVMRFPSQMVSILKKRNRFFCLVFVCQQVQHNVVKIQPIYPLNALFAIDELLSLWIVWTELAIKFFKRPFVNLWVLFRWMKFFISEFFDPDLFYESIRGDYYLKTAWNCCRFVYIFKCHIFCTFQWRQWKKQH